MAAARIASSNIVEALAQRGFVVATVGGDMAGMLSADQLKMTLFKADLIEDFQTWVAWEKIVGEALNASKMFGLADPFIERYQALQAAGDQQGFLMRVVADQMDNYIMASLALHIMGMPSEIPLVAYAAANKRLYPGLQGEIANLRTLLLMGFDVDAQTFEDGKTALHSMCGLKWAPGIHVRAVEALLDAGANPNVQNHSGDSAFTYICGSWPWSTEVHQAATLMLGAGADAHLPAADGSTALSLLKTNQANQDNSGPRQALIDMVEIDFQAGQARPIQRTAPRL